MKKLHEHQAQSIKSFSLMSAIILQEQNILFWSQPFYLLFFLFSSSSCSLSPSPWCNDSSKVLKSCFQPCHWPHNRTQSKASLNLKSTPQSVISLKPGRRGATDRESESKRWRRGCDQWHTSTVRDKIEKNTKERDRGRAYMSKKRQRPYVEKYIRV